MTRDEVYDKCTEKIPHEPQYSFKVTEDGILKKADKAVRAWTVRTLLPQDAIDAIIDCAVEEAVMALKGVEKQ